MIQQTDAIMKRNSIYIIILSALVFFAGCQKNGFDTVYSGGDSIVSFAPSVAVTESSTKGALINENGPDAIAFDNTKSFFVTAWDNAEIPSIIIPNHLHTIYNYQEVKMKGSQWNTVYTSGGNEYSQEYIWKSGETKTFFAYSNLPVSGAEIAYVNPVSAGQKPQQQLIVSNLPSTAATQTDILMGCYYGDGNGTGTAGIVFSHPMTAVKFELGSVVGVSSFEITKISMEGVYSKGTALLTTESAFATLPENRFVWTPDGATTTVQQSVTTQPTTAAPAIGEAFLLIPQRFTAKPARIVVDVKINGTSSKLYYPLTSGEWKAGYTNTVVISYNGLPAGALPGLFSVSAIKQVRFSKGNLQFKAGNGTSASPEWRFAEHQYDYIGDAPGNNTADGTTRSTQAAWIDLFGWGATGRNPYGMQPYSISENSTDYKTLPAADSNEKLSIENGGDWGVCIGDGRTWRTLAKAEWQYLLADDNEKRAGLCAYGVTVMDKINCLVLYPDGYDKTKVVQTGDTKSYDTEEEWAAAEKSGVVCLPPAGNRYGDDMTNLGFGYYWTSNASNSEYASFLMLAEIGFAIDPIQMIRSAGQSVRLVTDAN